MTAPICRLFLDTNVISDLIHWDESDPEPIRERLLSASSSGLVRVEGSLEVLAELSRAEESTFRETSKLLYKLVERWWMLPLFERHLREVSNRGTLADPMLYMTRHDRRQLELLQSNKRKISAIAMEVEREAREYRERAESDRDEIIARLKAEGMTKSDIGKGYRQWFRNVDVGEWCRGELDKAAKLGRIKPSDECRANPRVFAPSLWHYTHYRLARIALEVGEGRKIESSDEHDARHYAAAATYGGILVTGDTVLRKACLMIGEPALRIMNMREAHLELERLLAATGECSPRP